MPGPGAPRKPHARRLLVLVAALLAIYGAWIIAAAVALLAAGR